MEQLKKAIITASGLMNEIADIAKDGKFSFFKEVWGLAPHIYAFGHVAANIENIKSEIDAGLTGEQELELINAVKQELDFDNDKAEQIAEQVIKWLLVTILTADSIIDAVKQK